MAVAESGNPWGRVGEIQANVLPARTVEFFKGGNQFPSAKKMKSKETHIHRPSIFHPSSSSATSEPLLPHSVPPSNFFSWYSKNTTHRLVPISSSLSVHDMNVHPIYSLCSLQSPMFGSMTVPVGRLSYYARRSHQQDTGSFLGFPVSYKVVHCQYIRSEVVCLLKGAPGNIRPRFTSAQPDRKPYQS